MYKSTNNKEVAYPKLSYKLVGILFDVYNNIGPGHKEKYYCNAISIALLDNDISFTKELYVPLYYKEKRIGYYFIDFLIEGKIVLETKIGDRFNRRNIDQVLSYLKSSNLKLGILANFTSDGIKFKRILNL